MTLVSSCGASNSSTTPTRTTMALSSSSTFREVVGASSPAAKIRTKTSSSSCTTGSVQKSLIAGYVAGEVGVIIGYPLDSAKVWLQTKQQQRSIVGVSSAPTKPNGTMMMMPRPGTRAASSLAMSVPHTTATTTLQSTVQWTRALYRGVGGPLVTVGLVQSLNFAIYDSTRRLLYAAAHSHDETVQPLDYLQDDSLLHVGVASVTAGAILAFVTSPLVMIKTKQQVQQISFVQAARQTVGQSWWSLRGVARGFGPHFLSETAGRGIYFCAYEMCKRAWTQQFPATAATVVPQQEGSTTTTTTSSISLMGRMTSAGVAGMICWTLIFPLDVLRNRLFASHEYVSAWTMSRRIYHECGVRGFFRGYGISIFRAGPVAALVLPIYDYTLEHLNRQA